LFSELALRGRELTAGPRRQILQVIGFNVGQVAFSLAVVSFILRAVGHTPGQLLTATDFGIALAAFVAHIVLNTSLVLGVVSLQTRQWLRHLARDWYREFAPQYLVLGASALLLTVLYFITPFHALLGLIPLALVHFSFRSYLRIREEAQKTFEKVVQLLERRDPYTGEHSGEVADLAADIAQELGIHGGELEMIRSVARVHDIGKVAVPDKILLKPGKLDPEEWEIMKRHAEVGADLLQGLAIYDRYAHVVRHEHEHWNGNGYPDGLQGELIPFSSRIISAADVYHALISDRPYRPAYDMEEALDIIRKMSGRQLDPRVVGALLRVLERREAEPQEGEENT
ncbi:MAG: HD-GYP domain-containing protein, partial [Candidatus Bipolaricaulota bacterium]